MKFPIEEPSVPDLPYEWICPKCGPVKKIRRVSGYVHLCLKCYTSWDIRDGEAVPKKPKPLTPQELKKKLAAQNAKEHKNFVDDPTTEHGVY